MAYIWKPNCRGILIGYNGILKSFSKDTTDFVVCQVLLFQCISIDVYAGKAGVLILAFFDLSCFLILYLDYFHMTMLLGVSDVLIHVAINLKLMILKVHFQ